MVPVALAGEQLYGGAHDGLCAHLGRVGAGCAHRGHRDAYQAEAVGRLGLAGGRAERHGGRGYGEEEVFHCALHFTGSEERMVRV